MLHPCGVFDEMFDCLFHCLSDRGLCQSDVLELSIMKRRSPRARACRASSLRATCHNSLHAWSYALSVKRRVQEETEAEADLEESIGNSGSY